MPWNFFFIQDVIVSFLPTSSMNKRLEEHTLHRTYQAGDRLSAISKYESDVAFDSLRKAIIFERNHMNYYGGDKDGKDDFPYSPSQIEPNRVFAPGSSGASSMDLETDSVDETQSAAASLTPPPSIAGRITSSSASEVHRKPGGALKDPPSSSSSRKGRPAKKQPPPGPSYTSKEQPVSFPKTYELRPYDVICGRNKFAFNQVGNRRFRVLVSLYLRRYFESTHRVDRHIMNIEIIDTIKKAGGYFLKRMKSGEWVEISDKEKRDKVGHALRDAASAFTANEESKRRRAEREPISGEDAIRIIHQGGGHRASRSNILQSLIKFDKTSFPG